MRARSCVDPEGTHLGKIYSTKGGYPLPTQGTRVQIILPPPLIFSLPPAYSKEKPQGHSPYRGDDLGAVVLSSYLVLQIEGSREVEATGLVRPIDIS